MKRLNTSETGFPKAFERLAARSYSALPEVSASVEAIIERVRAGGDEQLDACCAEFDGRAFAEIPAERLAEAETALDDKLARALRLAVERVRDQAERELPRKVPEFEDEIGVTLGRRHLPLRRAGLYVPGGRAAYPSSLIMSAVPAKVAGVSEIVAACPLDPETEGARAVMAAASICGVDRFFVMGGAHAVAAMAFGTKRVPRVDIVVGPGNAYVAEAKRRLYGIVNIDGIAGPTEVVILADATFPPAHAAADMLAQAEHGPDSRCVLMTPDADWATLVEAEITRQTAEAPRKEIIREALENFGAIVVVRDMEEGARLADQFAPEHLEIVCEEADRVAVKIRNAGAIFLGPWAPEALGDYLAGSNHILPTNGTSRFLSPVSAATFLRATNIIRATREGLEKLGDATMLLARTEGLHAHARSIELRLAKKP